MSTKIKSASVVTARIILGLIYFLFGLNFFLHFLPTPPSTEGPAENFTTGLFQSGYFFPFLKGAEVILGGLLLTGTFVPLALVILMPITLNILLFHVFLTDNAIMSIVIVALQLYLAWSYRDYYKPLFSRKSIATL
jgi:putative oxidoreductase